MEERLIIFNNIIDVVDEKGSIEIKDMKLEYSCNKYSAKKNNIYHITLNDKHLTKKSQYRIKYKCVTCSSIHIVGVTQFLRKINKCSHRCYLCCNKDEVKREQHKEFFKNNPSWLTTRAVEETVVPKTLQEMKEESELLFEEYDDDFKDNYFKFHLSPDDYSRISRNLLSIENGKRIVNNDLEYWPIFKTNNQMVFTSVFYDKINDMILRANQPILKCDNCKKEWRAKLLERFKNSYKILCNDCTLCNNTFKIRHTKNNINETILYQSQLEMKFIKWCNDHNLTINNGPSLPYVFNDKMRKYKVDFMVNNILIEIKDDHIWHLNQVASGKWKAKEDAAHTEIQKGTYRKYYLITPKNWVKCLNELLLDVK